MTPIFLAIKVSLRVAREEKQARSFCVGGLDRSGMKMVSVRGAKPLEPRLAIDWSPLWVYFQFPEEHLRLYHIGIESSHPRAFLLFCWASEGAKTR